MTDQVNEAAADRLCAIANEIYSAWEHDNDSRVGKMLRALADPAFASQYRADIADLHASLNAPHPARGVVDEAAAVRLDEYIQREHGVALGKQAAIAALQAAAQGWRIEFVCCGREDGIATAATWAEADAIREAYTSGVGVNPHGYSDSHAHESGHQRAAIIKRSAALPADHVDGETLARRFHEAYERLAPSFGYETRPETRAFDPTSANGRLMVAVCSELTAALPAVPEGMVLVPKVPTEAMLTAAVRLQGEDASLARAPALVSALHKMYCAMLAATPAHDQPEGSDNG